MKNKFILLFIFIIFVNFSAYSSGKPPFENIIIQEIPAVYKEIIFEDYSGNKINLNSYNNEIYLINFWATWCLPCKKEIASLDELHNINIEEIKIFPINIEDHNKYRSQKFFQNLEIKNLSIYFDTNSNLANLFRLRGIPTTIILNKNKQEVARILGVLDFSDKNFINWVKGLNNDTF